MIHRFLFDNPAPRLLDGTGLQADPETLARVRARQLAARDAMGTKWICHAEHRVTSKSKPPIPASELTRSAFVHSLMKRVGAENILLLRSK